MGKSSPKYPGCKPKGHQLLDNRCGFASERQKSHPNISQLSNSNNLCIHGCSAVHKGPRFEKQLQASKKPPPHTPFPPDLGILGMWMRRCKGKEPTPTPKGVGSGSSAVPRVPKCKKKSKGSLASSSAPLQDTQETKIPWQNQWKASSTACQPSTAQALWNMAHQARTVLWIPSSKKKRKQWKNVASPPPVRETLWVPEGTPPIPSSQSPAGMSKIAPSYFPVNQRMAPW